MNLCLKNKHKDFVGKLEKKKWLESFFFFSVFKLDFPVAQMSQKRRIVLSPLQVFCKQLSLANWMCQK